MRYELITEPATEPVTLAEVKDHLRITHESEDAYVGSLITAARHAIESHLGLFLINRDLDIYVDQWPLKKSSPWWDGVMDGAWVNLRDAEGYLKLPVKPISAIAEVAVYQPDGGEKIWNADNYYLQPGESPRLYKSQSVPWPPLNRAADAVRMRVTAGFGDSWNDVPGVIRQALLQLVAQLYAHRGDEPTTALSASGARALLAPYREAQL